MTYTPPDKIEIYAAALQSDINAERFQQVVPVRVRPRAPWLYSYGFDSCVRIV